MNAREAALLSAARDVIEYKHGLPLNAMLVDALDDLLDAVNEYWDEE